MKTTKITANGFVYECEDRPPKMGEYYLDNDRLVKRASMFDSAYQEEKAVIATNDPKYKDVLPTLTEAVKTEADNFTCYSKTSCKLQCGTCKLADQIDNSKSSSFDESKVEAYEEVAFNPKNEAEAGVGKWILSSEQLPNEGENVEISDDGINVRETADYKTDRRCMMAGIAAGNGYFSSLGFATDGTQCDANLILDTPKYWRRYEDVSFNVSPKLPEPDSLDAPLSEGKQSSDVVKAAEMYAEENNSAYTNDYYGFIAGAKWQSEKQFPTSPLNVNEQAEKYAREYDFESLLTGSGINTVKAIKDSYIAGFEYATCIGAEKAQLLDEIASMLEEVLTQFEKTSADRDDSRLQGRARNLLSKYNQLSNNESIT